MTNYYRFNRSGMVYYSDRPLDPECWTPVVVIDPDDDEAVERLADIFCAYPSSGWVEQMQAALREFANPTPPKPDEPTGVGALVRDDEGDLWQRDNYSPGYPWRRLTNATGDFNKSACDKWEHITAVEVIFAGVDE